VVVQGYIPPPDLERKCEIMSEINDIWMDMKRMARAGTLNEYLSKKFDTKIPEDETTERFEMVDDSDNIDYDDDSIDWNNELDKYI
jgi:hypothetical protein